MDRNETLSQGMLCASDFWDAQYTWYPENGPPDFTPCFHKTALVWVPCVQLWVTSLVEVNRAKASQAGPIPWSLLNILKTLLLVMVMATSAGQLVIACLEYHTAASILAPLLKLFTFGLSLMLMLQFKRKGVRTSSVQWFFWLVMAVCQGFTFGSVINNPYNLGLSPSITNDYLILVEYVGIFSLFILNCFVDAQPEYKDPKGKSQYPC